MTRSIDTRTRAPGQAGPANPETFWTGEWREAIARHGERAADDAARLNLPPLAIAVDGDVWTLRRGANSIDAIAGCHSPTMIYLDADAFADLICERRSALGLVIAMRAAGDPASYDAFCAWDPVLRSVLDGRHVYRSGDVTLTGLDGEPLDLEQRFRLGERPEKAARFLAEAGFLLLSDVFTDDEMDAVDADLVRAVADARQDDGGSWWAATGAGEHYPCRILNFERRSAALRAIFDDPRFLAIGGILNDGHRPGDPFGEHFSDVTAEGLLKRVDSIAGLSCLPWHKDCDRGGHSMYCSGLTIGICLTPIDKAHGGLDVMAGSHRANIARAQADRGIDLPRVSLQAARGDVTVHLSCALHRSTHPEKLERRVAYTGFTLPPRPGDSATGATRSRLERERAAIGDPSRRGRLSAESAIPEGNV